MTSAELRDRTKAFSVEVLDLIDALPPKPSARVIANQLGRSATSTASNYRAACRSRSKAEFYAKLCTVVEEADETVLWLELVAEKRLVPSPGLKRLLVEANELCAIFVASRKTFRDPS